MLQLLYQLLNRLRNNLKCVKWDVKPWYLYPLSILDDTAVPNFYDDFVNC